MFLIEEISDEAGKFVQIFDTNLVTETKFITPESFNFQLGFAVDPDGRTYIPHVHTNIERTIFGTAEFIFVLSGQMNVTFLDGRGQPVREVSLRPQMGFLQTRGGHAISTLPGTRFFEVKQGPYAGRDADKFTVSLPPRSSAL
jgi:hypothetical protein